MLVRASTAKQRYAQPGGHASRQRRTGHTQAGKLEQLSCGLLRCARCTQAYRLNSARFSWPYQRGARKVGSSQALADPRRLCRPCTGYAKEETADQSTSHYRRADTYEGSHAIPVQKEKPQKPRRRTTKTPKTNQPINLEKGSSSRAVAVYAAHSHPGLHQGVGHPSRWVVGSQRQANTACVHRSHWPWSRPSRQ